MNPLYVATTAIATAAVVNGNTATENAAAVEKVINELAFEIVKNPAVHDAAASVGENVNPSAKTPSGPTVAKAATMESPAVSSATKSVNPNFAAAQQRFAKPSVSNVDPNPFFATRLKSGKTGDVANAVYKIENNAVKNAIDRTWPTSTTSMTPTGSAGTVTPATPQGSFRGVTEIGNSKFLTKMMKFLEKINFF